MSNTWKYSSVGQNERFRLIGSGNADVYRSEKELNSGLRKLRESLGLSTDEVDKWDKEIDNAYNASKQSREKENLPKYTSSKLTDLNSALAESVKELKKQRDEGIKSINLEAENSLDVLEEWLASNGYFKDGGLATKSKKEIEDALDTAIAQIKKDYETKLKNTRSKFLSMAQ